MLPFIVPIKTRQVEDGKGGQVTKWPVLVQTMFNLLTILRLSYTNNWPYLAIM